MPTWIDAVASRSGPLFTAATQFAAVHGLDCDPPRGVFGLQALSKLISGARHTTTAEHPNNNKGGGDDDDGDGGHGSHGSHDEGERQFVAGAGAYLGLLLLDHLPNGAHVANGGEHRLRLSAHGFFDPFAAVADALNARDAARALLAAIKRAEAEADGSGPTARVVKALQHRLAELARVEVVEHFDQRIWLDVQGARVELDLTRIISTTMGESDALLAHAVERLCASLVRESAPLLAWDGAKPLLYPRLVGKAFVDSLPEPGDLCLRPLAADVWEALVLRFKDRARFVRRAEVAAWAPHTTSVRGEALRNLASCSGQARLLQHFTLHGPLVVAQSRDGLDAARLMLPGLYDVLAPTLGARFLVATPHRDTLLAGPVAPAPLVAELKTRTAAAVRGAPHAISPRLWLVTGPGQVEPYSHD